MDTEDPIDAPLDATLVQALRQHLQSTTGEAVTLIETHISWVLLTGQFAYKLKKPVRLSFVDFGTLAARLHYCEEELRLNRRLAPSLYLDVLPVRGTAQAPHIGGAGETIDHVVRMRRFPDGALLCELLEAGRLDALDLRQLADRIADFHREAPVVEGGTHFGTPAKVFRPVMEVLGQVESEVGLARMAALRFWADAQPRVLREAWLARHRTGAVRECHGDLHLANVVKLGDEVLAFDCLEFDPALRWIDTMSDVAFLTMDLKARGRADLAGGFLDDYLQRSGDYAGLAVLRFYEVYRALVRALVACIRSRNRADDAVVAGPDYLACAERMARADAPAARLLITHGLSGSGKSTLARKLVAATGAIRLRSDVERKRLFGLGALQRSAAQGIDIYSADATRLTFARLRELAADVLGAGHSVIVDAAFLQGSERREMRALAADLGVPFTILDCQASVAQLRQRVSTRNAVGADASEADVAVLERQIAFNEPLDDEELAVAIPVDTEQAVDVAAVGADWLSKPASV